MNRQHPSRHSTPAPLPSRRARAAATLSRAIEPLEGRTLLSAPIRVTPAAAPSGGDGLFGAYYGDLTFAAKKFQRVDAGVNFNWAAGSPNAAVPADNFTVRWTGQVQAPDTGAYTFFVNSDDGARLTVNGQTIIDKLTPNQGLAEWSGGVDLVAGLKYNVQLEYVETTGNAQAQLRWTTPTIAKQIVPQAALFSVLGTNPPAPLLGAPQSVSATGASTSTLQLNWADVANESGYKLEWSPNGTTGWAQFKTLPANTTAHLDTGAAANTTYFYRLRAYNSAGNGPYSAVFSAKTLGSVTPPQVPAAPATATAVGVSNTTLQLNWADVATETGYKLEWSPNGSANWAQFKTFAANVTSYLDTGAVNTTYYYRVRGYNAAGDGPYSAVFSGKTLGGVTQPQTPAAPTGVSAAGASTSTLQLAWADLPNETGYKIEWSPNGSANWVQFKTFAANVTSYLDVGGTPNTTYYYRLRAFNAAGDGPYSAVFNGKTLANSTPTTPPAPTGVLGEGVTSSSIRLSWIDTPNETGYLLQWSPDGTTGWEDLIALPANTTEYFDSAPANTGYFYRVRGSNAAGPGPFSAVFSGKTLAANQPIAPVITAVRPVTVTGLEVTWGDVANESGYQLERALTPSGVWTTVISLPANTTTYTDPGLAGSTLFHYRVRGTAAVGNSPWSAVASATTFSGVAGPAATTPTNVAAQALTNTQIKISWTDSANEGVYELERSPNGTTGWTKIADPGINFVNYTDSGLTGDTTYFYRIRAGNNSGFSLYSSVVSAKTFSSVTPPLPGPNSTYQPDAYLQIHGEAGYVGDGVYNTTGLNQTKTGTAQFYPIPYKIRIQNDGNSADAFIITGPAGDANWRLSYHDSWVFGWNGAKLVTDAATTVGWNTGVIQPGQYKEFRVEILQQAAVGGALGSWDVTMTSVVNPLKKDVARLQLQNPVKNAVTWKRRNFDASGTYLMEIQNQGNVADGFDITAGLNNAGFAVQFFDDQWQGNDITSAVRSAAGYRTKVLQPWETQEFRVVFSNYANPSIPSINLLAASVANPNAKEVLGVGATAPTTPPVTTDFFPIGVWGMPVRAFDSWKARGANTMVEYQGSGATMAEWDQAARDRGLYYMRTPALVAADDIGDTHLLAWTLPDEPELPPGNPRNPPDQMAAKYAALKQIDPTRPIWQNLSGGFVLRWQGDLRYGDYAPYLANIDWVSSSIYPVTGFNRTQVNEGLDGPGQLVDTLEKWSGGKPQFAFVEVADQELSWMPKEAGVVTPAQFRAQFWDTIIHGAKGVTYFPESFNPTFDFDNTPDNVAAEMAIQHALVQQIAPAILSNTDPSTRGLQTDAPVEGTWRVYNGKTYYVLLNFSDQAVTQQVTFQGVGNAASATVIGENRTVNLTNGSFTESFAPFSVHIYQVG